MKETRKFNFKEDFTKEELKILNEIREELKKWFIV